MCSVVKYTAAELVLQLYLSVFDQLGITHDVCIVHGRDLFFKLLLILILLSKLLCSVQANSWLEYLYTWQGGLNICQNQYTCSLLFMPSKVFLVCTLLSLKCFFIIGDLNLIYRKFTNELYNSMVTLVILGWPLAKKWKCWGNLSVVRENCLLLSSCLGLYQSLCKLLWALCCCFLLPINSGVLKM